MIMSRIFSSAEPDPQLTWTAMFQCQLILQTRNRSLGCCRHCDTPMSQKPRPGFWLERDSQTVFGVVLARPHHPFLFTARRLWLALSVLLCVVNALYLRRREWAVEDFELVQGAQKRVTQRRLRRIGSKIGRA